MDQSFQLKTDDGLIQQNKTAASALSDINQDFKEKNVFQTAQKAGLGYVNLVTTPINPDFLRLLTKAQAEEAQSIIYFRIGKKVKIGVVDPENKKLLEITQQFEKDGYTMYLNLMSEESLHHGLELYALHDIKEKKVIENVVDENALDVYEKEIQNLSSLQEKLKTISSDEGLNIIFVGAYKTGASDIHIDPEEKQVHIRFRIDGVIQDIFAMENHVYEKILTQLKYNTKMRLNVRDIPQDGRTSFSMNNKRIDVRVSTLPTEFGETVVMRLLDKEKNTLEFTSLGYEGQPLQYLQEAIKKSHGMILVTGPTGSGKTTTLYAILQKLNKPENKIITLEDPIEYHIDGISQSQINEKIGYTFAQGLRASIRQDPDIIMVGEIRDLETAQIASQAALTGHIVLSTLHTNNAVDTIPRLINMGLLPYMIAPSLNAIIAQRLVRKVCQNCKKTRPLSPAEKQDIEILAKQFPEMEPTLKVDSISVANIGGCDACSHTGYKGQIAIAEVVLMTEEVKKLIFEGVSEVDLFHAIRKNGFMTLKEYGILQALKGVVSMEEVYRVANE